MEAFSDVQEAETEATSPSADPETKPEGTDLSGISKFRENFSAPSLLDTPEHAGNSEGYEVKPATSNTSLVPLPEAASPSTAALPSTRVENPQTQLNQARQTLVKNEMHTMLREVQGLERRLSKTASVLSDQEQDLGIREARAAQREDWLRHRENSVLKRERNAQRRELLLMDREAENPAQKRKRDTKSEDQHRKSSSMTASRLFGWLHGGRQALVFDEEADDGEDTIAAPETPCPSRIGLRARFQRDGEQSRASDGSIDDVTSQGAAEHIESSAQQATQPRDLVQPRSVSFDIGERSAQGILSATEATRISDPSVQQISTPEAPVTPLRRGRSLIQRFSPFTPRTPPPPYRSPSAIQPLSPAMRKSGFWTKTCTASKTILDHMFHPSNTEAAAENRQQRLLEKLEQEVREADARLERARKEQRQKALNRLKEMQRP